MPSKVTPDWAKDDPYAERESQKYQQPIASREHILEQLEAAEKPLNYEQIAERLDITDDNAREALRRRLGAMLRDAQLIKNRRREFIPLSSADLVKGRVLAHPDGYGFLSVDGEEVDLYLHPKQMQSVLHGDRVLARVSGVDRRGRKEGAIVEVVERANQTLVGRLQIDSGVAYVVPDDKRIHQDVNVPLDELGGAKHDDIVQVAILKHPNRRHPPLGKVIKCLGQHMMPGMEIEVAMHAHQIPMQWSDEAVAQAAQIPPEVAEADKVDRLDLRDLPLVTIDGEDAKDFDDAVYCEPRPTGWRLYVAIADVAHYVTADSALDTDAQQRGNSVYFPGQVVPMLPESLSNGLCSLNPNVDRLSMVCSMFVNKKTGKITRCKFYNGVIRSHARLTYTQVWQALSGEDESAVPEAILPHVKALYDLYQVLRATRETRGAMDFDTQETRIIFDDERKIDAIVPTERNPAHMLIEECMISANVMAAQFLGRHKMPTLYRVHEGPKTEKLDELRDYLAVRGLQLGGGEDPQAEDYAEVMRTAKGRDDIQSIQTMLLRSLSQAVYQPENHGHFGLALEEYAHFTSPIRRYPDLLVHRGIKHLLAFEKPSTFRYGEAQMSALGDGCSQTERRADEAVRDVTDWLKCEYIQDHVGEDFDGVISTVTAFGAFVLLRDVFIEGLLHISNLPGDYYEYDPIQQVLKGRRTGRRFALGGSVRIRVARVNLDDRKIDLELLDTSGEPQTTRKRRGGRGTAKVLAEKAAPPKPDTEERERKRKPKSKSKNKSKTKVKDKEKKKAKKKKSGKARSRKSGESKA